MKKLRNIAFLLIPLFVLAACSVKEDRTYCPSYLTVYAQVATKALGDGNAEVRLYNETEETLLENSVVLSLAALAGQGAVMPVYKNRDYRVLGLTGIDGFEDRDGGLFIPAGQDCPPLQTFSLTFRTGETEQDYDFYEKFRRDHFRLTLNIINGFDPHPFTYSVKGGVDGFIPGEELELSEGEFTCELQRTEREAVSFDCLIPRHGEHLGILKLLVHDDLAAAPVKTIKLGEILLQNGYRSDAAVLEDVEMDIDLSLSRINITVADWTVAVNLEQIEI